MLIQTKYFRSKSKVAIIVCECGRTIVHDLYNGLVMCPYCDVVVPFEDVLETLLVTSQSKDFPILSERKLNSRL